MHVQLEPLQVEPGQKKQRFREVLCNQPLLQVSQSCCAHVLMLADEEKVARQSTTMKQLGRIAEKQVLRKPLTDQEKALIGQI